MGVIYPASSQVVRNHLPFSSRSGRSVKAYSPVYSPACSPRNPVYVRYKSLLSQAYSVPMFSFVPHLLLSTSETPRAYCLPCRSVESLSSTLFREPRENLNRSNSYQFYIPIFLSQISPLSRNRACAGVFSSIPVTVVDPQCLETLLNKISPSSAIQSTPGLSFNDAVSSSEKFITQKMVP